MTDAAKKKKTWVSVVIAILIIFVILGVAMVGGAAFWFRKHVSSQLVAPEVANEELERARARFAGAQPLIELRDDHEEAVIHRRTAATRTELQSLRVIAFDPQDGKLVRVTIPFWLLRLTGKRFGLRDSGIDFDTDRVHLTVDDLERAGPGLILDARSRRDGTQVIVWAE